MCYGECRPYGCANRCANHRSHSPKSANDCKSGFLVSPNKMKLLDGEVVLYHHQGGVASIMSGLRMRMAILGM